MKFICLGYSEEKQWEAKSQSDRDAMTEECFTYDECDQLHPFVAAGKAVFNVEYGLGPARFCPRANSPRFDLNSIRKTDDLFDLPYRPCR